MGELTLEDLANSPVWRYEGGEGGDAMVAAVPRESLSQWDDEIFLAATSFALADSTAHSGFCFPADDSGVDYLQPVIVTRMGHVSFWFDGPIAPETLERQWRSLGKTAREIFPVGFRCLVPVDGRTVSGRIEGVESSHEVGAAAAPARRELSERAPAKTRRRGIGTGEKRTARRRDADMTVEFTQGSIRGTGVVGDVSRRGMFVRSNWIPGAGPMVRLTVKLPGGRRLVLSGRVVRTSEPIGPSGSAQRPGFGLRLSGDWPDYDDLFSKRRK
jgi:PilZ domain